MFIRLQLPQHSAYDNTFFWSGECLDNEVLYSIVFYKLLLTKNYFITDYFLMQTLFNKMAR